MNFENSDDFDEADSEKRFEMIEKRLKAKEQKRKAQQKIMKRSLSPRKRPPRLFKHLGEVSSSGIFARPGSHASPQPLPGSPGRARTVNKFPSIMELNSPKKLRARQPITKTSSFAIEHEGEVNRELALKR